MQLPSSGKPFSHDFELVRRACIALLVAQAPFLAATMPLGLHVPAAVAQTQSAEAIGKIAQTITVRIEGATQGSGVIVKREGNRYTVLTAWHVVSGQRPGEELDIYTPDGQRHQVEQGSINQLGDVDMAVLSFSSSSNYIFGTPETNRTPTGGDAIVTAGFPVGSKRSLTYHTGSIYANATMHVTDGYQLLYTNRTHSGISGGPILNGSGRLIGIHGRGTHSDQDKWRTGLDAKSDLNQGIPVSYFLFYESSQNAIPNPRDTNPLTQENYMHIAYTMIHGNAEPKSIAAILDQGLLRWKKIELFAQRAIVRSEMGDAKGAAEDYSAVISMDPGNFRSYSNRSAIKQRMGDLEGAISDVNMAISLNRDYLRAYYNRGVINAETGKCPAAIADYSTVLEKVQDALSFHNRGECKRKLGDISGAIADYTSALEINPNYARAYSNRGFAYVESGEPLMAIPDLERSISLSLQSPRIYGLTDKTEVKHDLNNLGRAYLAVNNTDAATEYFSKAIDLDGSYVYAYRNRGVAYWNSGDIQRACKDWRSAARLGDQEASAWIKRCR